MNYLSSLVRNTFEADIRVDPPKYKFRNYYPVNHWSLQQSFGHDVVTAFEWDIAALSIGGKVSAKRYLIVGAGLIVGTGLKEIFSSAGFGDYFVFYGNIEKDDKHMTFTSNSAPLTVQATVPASGPPPDHAKLDAEVGKFLTMATLSASGLTSYE